MMIDVGQELGDVLLIAGKGHENSILGPNGREEAPGTAMFGAAASGQ